MATGCCAAGVPLWRKQYGCKYTVCVPPPCPGVCLIVTACPEVSFSVRSTATDDILATHANPAYNPADEAAAAAGEAAQPCSHEAAAGEQRSGARRLRVGQYPSSDVNAVAVAGRLAVSRGAGGSGAGSVTLWRLPGYETLPLG